MASSRTAYVAFATPAPDGLTVAGRLDLPPVAPPGPAVLICHGSDGVDGRGAFYADALNVAGLATLEIDMWAARGSARGAAARPGSPLETLPDAFAALAFLSAQPEIDPARIGILGFSWGGVVSLMSATRRCADAHGHAGPRFAAHAANYPVCWAYGRARGLDLTDLTGAPVLLQVGDNDGYDEPDAGAQLLARLHAHDAALIELVTHKGAGHGFDRDLPAQTINDPFSHGGKGGAVEMRFNRKAAEEARGNVVRFFTTRL
ncbi:MAG: dienelactone hydrolase family protein [Caulobacteraceae bacterium]